MTTPPFQTPLQKAKLDEINKVREPKVEKVWSYADSKDLSMNIGGILHDSSTLIGKTEGSVKEIAQKVIDLAYEIYLAKEELISKIKKQ